MLEVGVALWAWTGSAATRTMAKAVASRRSTHADFRSTILPLACGRKPRGACEACQTPPQALVSKSPGDLGAPPVRAPQGGLLLGYQRCRGRDGPTPTATGIGLCDARGPASHPRGT